MGDRNTKFFHATASNRKKKNNLVKLRDENGDWVESYGLSNVAVNYFKQIFATNGVHFSDHLGGIRKRVTDEVNGQLLRQFTVEEVREAVFSMAPPGPDGFNPAFYQHFWAEIDMDVSIFVIDCLNQRRMPCGMNDAHITLVPKKALPECMSDLRPIALCNVVYKILAKMLANRFKGVLGDVISDTQSAFIPGRLITDNVLIASEVLHYLKRKQNGNRG